MAAWVHILSSPILTASQPVCPGLNRHNNFSLALIRGNDELAKIHISDSWGWMCSDQMAQLELLLTTDALSYWLFFFFLKTYAHIHIEPFCTFASSFPLQTYLRSGARHICSVFWFVFKGWVRSLAWWLQSVPGFPAGVMMADNQVSPLSELVAIKAGPLGRTAERTESHFTWYFLFLERTSNMFGKWQKQ